MTYKQTRVVNRDAAAITAPFSSMYGNQQLFDPCFGDAITSLSLMFSTPSLLNWLGAELSDTWTLEEKFLSYIGPSGTSAGTPSAGWISDPCSPGNRIEWGLCDTRYQGFGRLRRTGAPRDIFNDTLKWCEASPIYRIDGTRVENEAEWDLVSLAATMTQDLASLIISGNSATAGQFSGLMQLIKYNYTNISGASCKAMDSIVIDWADNELCPSTAPEDVTVNGVATEISNLIDMLRWAIRRVVRRIRTSGFGGSGRITQGDIAIVMPGDYISCLLDCWTCYAKCGNDITTVNSYEARTFRQSLNGGLYGDGVLLGFEGLDIPIIAHDYDMIDSVADNFDMMILTRRIGNQPVIRMQFQDPSGFRLDGVKQDFRITDGGYQVSWTNIDETCRSANMQWNPRIIMRAPWAQIKVLNVKCTGLPNVISSQPSSPLFPGYGDVKT